MQVTGGYLKGRKVETPKSARPTLSKIRECVFNTLNSMFLNENELSFLDMFSGSSIMTIEAISRNYKTLSLEIDKNAIRIIKNNFKKLNIETDIINVDSMKFLKKSDLEFDVIYIDPPWENMKLKNSDILKLAFSHLSKRGVVVLEFDKDKSDDLSEFQDRLIKIKNFGRCELRIYGNI